jgi:hypothetical protein
MTQHATTGRFTRGGLLRTALAGGAAAAGGAALGARGGTTQADDRSTDTAILNAFLQLEQAQQALYAAALRTDVLDADLRAFAKAAADQEAAHVAFLRDRLGGRAQNHQAPDPHDAVSSPASFKDAAVTIEEGAIALYVGQAPNLSRRLIAPIGVLVSVEARQAAWIRDLAGVSPAPRAQDAGRSPDVVLAHLRSKGLLA